jgi:hypothetical protein
VLEKLPTVPASTSTTTWFGQTAAIFRNLRATSETAAGLDIFKMCEGAEQLAKCYGSSWSGQCGRGAICAAGER